MDQADDSFNRMIIVDLILDYDLKLGADLLRVLAQDTSMDLTDRISCIERLIGMNRQSAIDALADGIADPGNSVHSVLKIYAILAELDTSAAVAALARMAADPVRGGYARAIAGLVLYRDARPEGLRAFRELSADPNVPGFTATFTLPSMATHARGRTGCSSFPGTPRCRPTGGSSRPRSSGRNSTRKVSRRSALYSRTSRPVGGCA